MKISKRFCLRLALFLFIIFTIKTYAQLFLLKVDYATGAAPFSVAIGDINGDNKPDLAVACRGSNKVCILLGNGDGTFQNNLQGSATGFGPQSVAIGDFNGDNKPDLAVANTLDQIVSVLLGNGDGTFQNKVDYATGIGPYSVAIGDFNGDNKLDLAVANSVTNNVSILLGNGDGTFQNKVDYAAGTNPCSVAIGDFNGDNKLDLSVANSGSNTVSILIGNGDGTFQNKVDYATGGNPQSVAIGDLNGDNNLDLAVANNGSNKVSILLGNSNGTFQNKVDYATSAYPYSVAIGDLNGDNNLDLAVANNGGNNVSILLGIGNGIFQYKVDYGTGGGPHSVAIGDFNGDNKPDLAVANYSSNNVSILIHTNNTLPTAANGSVTINEDNIKTFAASEFNYNDADGDPLNKIQITSLPSRGTLFKDNNLNSVVDAGESILLNGEITKAEIDANKLKFTPVLNENGSPYTTYNFKVHDGTAYSSNSYTLTINVNAVNDAPVLAAIENTALSYIEGDAPKVITNAVTVNDTDDANMSSAVVQITGNYQSSEDVLSFTNQNGITGNWNSVTGTMSLSGNSSVANYQTALRAVKYNNISLNPNTTNRTVSFTVNDGTDNSNTVTRQINVTSVNNPAVLANMEGTSINYNVGDPAIVITNTITISDVDNTNMSSAVVQITSNYASGEDVLSFINQNGIIGTWNSLTGTMNLSGSATIANYQTALRNVKYNNNSSLQNSNARTISFTINDGSASSNTLTRQINVNVNVTPSAPTGINISQITVSCFIVSWLQVSNATNYYIDLSTSSTFSTYVGGYQNKSVGNVTSYQILQLVDNTTYFLRVRSSNQYGVSNNSAVVTATTAMIHVGVVNALPATMFTNNSFTANWSSDFFALGYQLDVATDASFVNMLTGYNNLDVGQVTSKLVTGVNQNTTYYYRVRPYNTSGVGTNSNIVSVILSVPDPPVATAASGITQTKATENWNVSSKATGYYIDIAFDAGFTTLVGNNVDVGNVTNVSYSPLAANTTYFYRLRAYNGVGISGNSNVISFTTLMNPPPAPVAISPSNINANSFTAKWNSTPTANKYLLDVAPDVGFTNPLPDYNGKDVGNVLSYTVADLTPNTKYYYRVWAYNNGGLSPVSNEIIVNLSTDVRELGIPTSCKLEQNYPNPFNPSTKIVYHLPRDGFVTLKVFDVLGREVVSLVSENQNAGSYEVTLYGKQLASGVYLCVMNFGDHLNSMKMLIMK